MKTENKQAYTTTLPVAHIVKLRKIRDEIGIPTSVQITKALSKSWRDEE